jgi:hypothetical protein
MRFFLFLALINVILFADKNDNIELAEKYLSGVIGAKIEYKKMLNDEYFEHLENGESTKGMSKYETVKVVQPNYKKGILILEKETEKGNVKAATALYTFLIRWVNFKDKKPEKNMIKRMERELKISYKTYLDLINKSLSVIKHYCGEKKNEKINSYTDYLCYKFNS